MFILAARHSHFLLHWRRRDRKVQNYLSRNTFKAYFEHFNFHATLSGICPLSKCAALKLLSAAEYCRAYSQAVVSYRRSLRSPGIVLHLTSRNKWPEWYLQRTDEWGAVKRERERRGESCWVNMGWEFWVTQTLRPGRGGGWKMMSMRG